MALTVSSTDELAYLVSRKAVLPSGSEVVPVAEFAPAFNSPCDATELLALMGWMTAGPPTLAAEVLRSAGRWAWVRYSWALEDRGLSLRPTDDARSIRGHTRSLFSETVGVGAAGYLGCLSLVPPGWLAVANLDDTFEPLERGGVIRRRPGWGKRAPDYLIAGKIWSSIELLAIECKGTIKGGPMAIEQLASGARQVVGIESDFPLRRVVFATTLELDGKDRRVRTYAVEVIVDDGPGGRPDRGAAQEGVLDAALIRALRCAGIYGAAELRRAGHPAESAEPMNQFQIADEWVAGQSAELLSQEALLRADIGVDLDYLRALEAAGPERRARVEPAIERLVARGQRRSAREDAERGPLDSTTTVRREVGMLDGIALRFERRPSVATDFEEPGSVGT